MQVKQIASLMNTVTGELLGKTGIVNEDLSNVVDMGKELFSNTDVDNYVKTLVDVIGKMIFVDRVYQGRAPSVLMDGWEYGSVLEKIQMDLPDATENETWNLVDGQTYNPNVFYQPKVSAKFFNNKVTFEIPMSFTERQVKESFNNATQLNAFLSMIYNNIEKAMTVKLDALIMRTINNFTAETLYSEYPNAEYSTKSGVRAVNVLKLYNDENGTELTVAQAKNNPEFIRFLSNQMMNYIDRLKVITSLYNIGGKDRFTPKDYLHVVMLTEVKNAANTYLQSDTFHEIYTALPEAETVPYWQGTGTDYGFDSTSKIHVTNDGHTVETSGILAVMFDRDALGVANMNRRVTSQYNAKAEFINNWYKMDAGYFNDLNENFIVFFMA